MNLLSDILQLVELPIQLSMVVMTGIYFIFSNTIMSTLRSTSNGADIMVEINRVILNPLFTALFISSGLGALLLAFTEKNLLSAAYIVFFVGTTLATMIKNVPWNNRLRDSEPGEARQQVWQEYLSEWVFWNHLRTVSAIVAMLLLLVQANM